MSTIKITGYKGGLPTTIGDTDTAVIDGSLTIGDSTEEDVVTINAEFASDLIPDAPDSYDLGSASKKWRFGYFEQINAKQRHVNTAKYTNNTDNSQQYVRWDNAGSNGEPGVNNKFLAPADGKLLSVSIRSNTVANSTVIAFHKASNGEQNLSTTPIETQTANMSSENTAYQVNFSNAIFTAGQILGISVNPNNTPNDVNLSFVWLFDWNA